jgi:hypothetical protein
MRLGRGGFGIGIEAILKEWRAQGRRMSAFE